MATIRTVERQIRDVEGFEVRIHFSGPGRERGPDVRSDRQDVPGYPFGNRRNESDTVATWRQQRFEKTYPGFTAVVLLFGGSEAAGQTLLSTVRDTYL